MTVTASNAIAHVLPVLSGGGVFFPEQASTIAPDMDALFWAIFWISAVFFVLIVGATLIFMIVYRRSKHPTPLPSHHHNMRLEIVWSIIPLILLVVICLWSLVVYWDFVTPPKGAQLKEIHVNASQWNWNFEYPAEGFNVDRELHVVKGERTQLIMNSAKGDVTHSLYIPAFRVKQDVIPGRYTKLWFEASKAGTFPLYCTEYCGTNHSNMLANVIVHETKAGYDEWASGQNTDKMPLPDLGKRLYQKCMACHSVDGSRVIGPSLKGIFGKVEELEGGGTAAVDEEYIRESLINPSAKVVKGYPPAMSPFQFSEREYLAIIEFIKAQK